MLRIMIADDHDIVRRGVRDIIEAHAGWEVCGEACNGQAALELALQEKPDVAVLDVAMPRINGVSLTRQLRHALPATKVLLFTMDDDDETVSAALAAGARGYVLKTDSEETLSTAISALESGHTFFSPPVMEFLLSAALKERQQSRLESFTVRELHVAQLVCEGATNPQIGERLGISVKTVESHRTAVMRKAGVKTAAALVRFAVKHKLIQP